MSLTVNGETVDDALLEAEFGQIKAHYEQQANVSCCERDEEFMGYAKEKVIARLLLAQEATARIPAPAEEEVEAKLEELKSEYGGEEAFYYSLGIAPGGEAKVRDEIATGLRVDRLVEEVTAPAPDPDGAEVRAYYEAHADDFMSEEEVRAMHIFKSLQKAERREDLFRELREVRGRAAAGEDFMELVRAHSDKPEDEADLGWYKRGELMDEFELITFSMEVGEISPVFATQWGMHLAKLTGRREPQPIEVAEVEEVIRERIAAEHRDAELERYIDGLKARGEIVDSEAGS